MNPNDCQSCIWRRDPEGCFCYWWYTEPTVNCNWFNKGDKR